MGRAAIHGLIALAMIAGAGAGQAYAQEQQQDPSRPATRARTFDEVRVAAEAGDISSMNTLGAMLATGEGVVEDDELARDWYQAAAERRSAAALRSYGMMMLTGEGGPQDPARGIALLQLAAEAGDENAELLLSITEDDAANPEEVDVMRKDWLDTHGAPLTVN